MKKDAIPYGVWAWKLNEIIAGMNNEEAYYESGWLYIWPDGETKQEANEDFGDKESYQELENLFIKVYKAYHRDGLYNVTPDVLDYAHKWDKKLGLAEIKDVKNSKTPDYNDEMEKRILETLTQNNIKYEEINEEADQDAPDKPYKVVYFGGDKDGCQKAFNVLKDKYTTVRIYRDYDDFQLLISNDTFEDDAADVNDSKSVKDTIINLDQLKEGQSVKLVDDLLFDEVETTKETYEDDYDKIFKEKLFDNVPYSYIPAGTILTLKEKYGPAGGWPCFIINGVEVDLCGELDEYKGILINEFKDSKVYVYKLVHDYNSENIDDESVEYDYWKKRFPNLKIEKIEKLTNIPNSNWKVTLVGQFNDLYKAAVYLGYDEDDIQDTLVFYDSKTVKDNMYYSLPKYNEDLADKISDIIDELDIDYDGDIMNGIAIPKSKVKIFEEKLNELDIDYEEYDETRSSHTYQGISFFDSKTVKDIKPRKNESKEDFISRFMEETKEEYPDQKQRLAVAYSYWERRNKKSTKDSLDNDLIEILVANGTCDTKKVAKQYISKMSKEEKDELWKSIKKQAQYLLVNDSVITDSEFSNSARGKFRVPAEPLGSVKVWYQNDDQIKKDYERLVEYAENNSPRADNPLLGVSTYEQTIGKDTKQVSEGYITLNGNRIVLVKDIDEQYVVDAMQEYYYEIADMSLEEFIETFVEDEQVFKEKMKQQTEAAKAEKKAAKEKEKEDNKIRQSFEGLIVYGAYVKVRDVYKKDFKPTEDKENSCYFEVSEHMTKDKSILKFINIYYHNSVLPVTVNNVFGKSNKYYDDNEKLCQIYLLNLDVFAIRQKINMIDYNDRLSASLKK